MSTRIINDIIDGITIIGRVIIIVVGGINILDGINSEIDIQIIHDRGTAIKTAVTTLREDECLLIAGKGHETTQTIGNKVLTFNDKKAVLDALI